MLKKRQSFQKPRHATTKTPQLLRKKKSSTQASEATPSQYYRATCSSLDKRSSLQIIGRSGGEEGVFERFIELFFVFVFFELSVWIKKLQMNHFSIHFMDEKGIHKKEEKTY